MVDFTLSEQSYTEQPGHTARAGRVRAIPAGTPRACRGSNARKRPGGRSSTPPLTLLEKDSFAALSLREVTREAGIRPPRSTGTSTRWRPLGLCLIDESFRTLRDMLRGARAANGPHPRHRLIGGHP